MILADFIGFRYGPYHSSDLHLIATSSSNRFNKNLLPSPKDYTLDIPGGDGQFYVGQTFQSREISINVTFTDMDEFTFRRLAQIFSSDKLQDLVFDEQPYKKYRAKCKSQPQFKYICFKDPQTQQRIYKGEGTLNFICYYPYAYCFNKYVVTAADYYKTTKPEQILNPMSINYNPYVHDVPPSLTNEIKLHYNIDHNMETPWDGGYPTIEQVQWGELYYTDKDGQKKLLTDVRRYWDNVPKWQAGAKLLTTPTLDYEQELIYMPQYSTTNYYNMETGLNKQNALIGSRILVYNSGDLPIDFMLYLDKLNNKMRKVKTPYRFRINRYDVQRLTIEQAVDWIGLRTYDIEDNEKYKYGTHYVGILETKELGNTTEQIGIDVEPYVRHLKDSHPKHLYFTEPVPSSDIVKYLKMFIYQTQIKLREKVVGYDDEVAALSKKISAFEKEAYEEFHNYEINYETCITDEEKYEIYWKLLLFVFNGMFECFKKDSNIPHLCIFETDKDVQDWLYSYIFNPLEFLSLSTDTYPNYNEINFNVYEPLNFITKDYIEIEANFEEEDNISLIFDSERRLLYNEIEEDEQYERTVKKVIYNDHIKSGNWFQLPPGWSLIEVTPVLLENEFQGERWLEARPFTWGGMSKEDEEIFNICEQKAIIKYVSDNSTESNLRADYPNKFPQFDDNFDYTNRNAVRQVLSTQGGLSDARYQARLESYIQFKNWYKDNEGYQLYMDKVSLIGKGFWDTYINRIEIEYLKLLNNYWRLAHLDKNGFPTSDAEDWWWCASSYIWSNFPPSYWGYIDVLNEARIEYVPEYY